MKGKKLENKLSYIQNMKKGGMRNTPKKTDDVRDKTRRRTRILGRVSGVNEREIARGGRKKIDKERERMLRKKRMKVEKKEREYVLSSKIMIQMCKTESETRK